MIIWLASYPRSGNTFFRIFLKNVFNQKTFSIYDDKFDIGADEKTAEVVGHEFLPRDFDITQAKKSEEIYFIKTHDLPSIVDEGDKVIYLVRDGRESILSYQKHLAVFSEKNVDITEIILGNVPFGSWANHVAEWTARDEENTMFVKFEKLIQNPEEIINNISSFINLKPLNRELPSFAELNKVNPNFFRSGETASWRRNMSLDDIALFDAIGSHMLACHGYDATSSPINSKKLSFLLAKYISDSRKPVKVSDTLKNVELQCADPQKNNEDLMDQIKNIKSKSDALRSESDLLLKKVNALEAESELFHLMKPGFFWQRVPNRERKKVTIVTVAYQAEDHIENTIRSVIEQNYDNFEYIVIDGGSSDDTLNIIKRYQSSIDVIVSEPDGGIYDAMNKAILLARGEWILFMNSNDWFVSINVLSDVFMVSHDDADFIYGDHQFIGDKRTFHVKARPLTQMWKRISFSHQALFSRTELMKKFKFDLSKAVVADYDFYYRCYSSGYRFKYLDQEVAAVSGGGFSSISFFRRTKERWSVVNKYTPSSKVNIFYFGLMLWGCLPKGFKGGLKRKFVRLRQLP